MRSKMSAAMPAESTKKYAVEVLPRGAAQAMRACVHMHMCMQTWSAGMGEECWAKLGLFELYIQ